MVRPPMMTVSLPTSPDAEDLSPYEIFHVYPRSLLKVDDLDGSKMLWPAPCDFTRAGSSVDQSFRFIRTMRRLWEGEVAGREFCLPTGRKNQCQSRASLSAEEYQLQPRRGT